MNYIKKNLKDIQTHLGKGNDLCLIKAQLHPDIHFLNFDFKVKRFEL